MCFKTSTLYWAFLIETTVFFVKFISYVIVIRNNEKRPCFFYWLLILVFDIFSHQKL